MNRVCELEAYQLLLFFLIREMKRGKMRFRKKKTKPTARLIAKKRVVTSILRMFNRKTYWKALHILLYS